MWTAQRLRSMRRAPRRWPTGPKLLFVASCRALSPPRHRGSARPVWVPSPATWWVWRGIFDDSASSRRLFLAGGRLGCVTLLNRADDRRSLARVPRGFNIITAVFTRAAGGSTRVSLSHSSTLFDTLTPATGTARREPYARRRRTRPSRPQPPPPAVSAPAARTRPSSCAAVDAPAPCAYPRRTLASPPRARCESRARARRRRTRRGCRRRRPEA